MANSTLCLQVEALRHKDSLSYQLEGDGPDQRYALQNGVVLQSSTCPFSWRELMCTAVCYASECWLRLPELSFACRKRSKQNITMDWKSLFCVSDLWKERTRVVTAFKDTELAGPQIFIAVCCIKELFIIFLRGPRGLFGWTAFQVL